MKQIKMVIDTWPLQPVCLVRKHVVLRRPQKDNYCQLNCSAFSPCVLRVPDPLTLSGGLTGPLALLLFCAPSITPPRCLSRPKMPFRKCLKCAHKTLVLLSPPLAKTRCRKLNRCNIWCLCVETVEISYSETHSKNRSCLTGMHANTAITGGRKLASVAATNPWCNETGPFVVM